MLLTPLHLSYLLLSISLLLLNVTVHVALEMTGVAVIVLAALALIGTAVEIVLVAMIGTVGIAARIEHLRAPFVLVIIIGKKPVF